MQSVFGSRVLGFALLVGCSGHIETNEPPNSGRPRPQKQIPRADSPQAFARLLAEVACENLLHCRLAYDDAAQLRALVGNTEACVERMALRIGDASPRLLSFDVSKLTYQPNEAQKCLTRFAHQCFVFEAEEPEDAFATICAEVFDGDVRGGDACATDLSCQGDAYCDVDRSDPCAKGVCRQRKADGERCSESRECSALGSEGAACGLGGQSPNTCVRVVSVLEVDEGQECGSSIDGHDARLAICAGELACPVASAGTSRRRCMQPKARGASCAELPECETGSICYETEAQGAVCTALDLQTAGEPCGLDMASPQPSFRHCADLRDRMYCTDAGLCADVRAMQEGESCERFACAQGLVCGYDPATNANTCVPPIALGEPCDGSVPCVQGACRVHNGAEVCVDQCK